MQYAELIISADCGNGCTPRSRAVTSIYLVFSGALSYNYDVRFKTYTIMGGGTGVFNLRCVGQSFCDCSYIYFKTFYNI